MLFSCHLWKVKLIAQQLWKKYWRYNTYNCCRHVPSAGPESPGWWPSPTSSVSPSSSSCPAACPFYFHSSPWTDLSRQLFIIFRTRTPPRGTPPRVFFLLAFSFSLFFQSFFLSYFSLLFKNQSLVPSLSRHLANRRPSFHLVLPSLELNSFFWYRFGMVAHCTSLVRLWSIARPVT